MARDASSSTTWQLSAGDSRLLHVAAGTRWVAARGMLRLSEPPRWLGERVLGPCVTLHDGEAHVFESAGWATVQALADSTLRGQTPASLVSRWWRSGRAWRVPATSF